MYTHTAEPARDHGPSVAVVHVCLCGHENKRNIHFYIVYVYVYIYIYGCCDTNTHTHTYIYIYIYIHVHAPPVQRLTTGHRWPSSASGFAATNLKKYRIILYYTCSCIYKYICSDIYIYIYIYICTRTAGPAPDHGPSVAVVGVCLCGHHSLR